MPIEDDAIAHPFAPNSRGIIAIKFARTKPAVSLRLRLRRPKIAPLALTMESGHRARTACRRRTHNSARPPSTLCAFCLLHRPTARAGIHFEGCASPAHRSAVSLRTTNTTAAAAKATACTAICLFSGTDALYEYAGACGSTINSIVALMPKRDQAELLVSLSRTVWYASMLQRRRRWWHKLRRRRHPCSRARILAPILWTPTRLRFDCVRDAAAPAAYTLPCRACHSGQTIGSRCGPYTAPPLRAIFIA